MLREDAKWRKRVNGDYRQLDEMSMEAFIKSGRNLFDSKNQFLPIVSKMSTTKYQQELRPEEEEKNLESASNQSRSRSNLDDLS